MVKPLWQSVIRVLNLVSRDVIPQTDEDTANFNWYDQIVSTDGFKGSDGTSGKIKKGFNLRNEYANTSLLR